MRLPMRAWKDTLAALGFNRLQKSTSSTQRGSRRIGFEPLERRQMMTVTSLYWVGGTATWDTATTGTMNWSTTSGGSANSYWANGDQAVFGGTAATVTVASGVSADSLKFTSAYTLSGAALALSGANTIDVSSSVNATISSTLSPSSSGFSKTNSGTLTLGGSNTYTGPTTVSAGILAAAALATGAFSSSSAFTVNGTLDLHGNNETIASLSSSSSSAVVTTSTSGTVTLTAGNGNSLTFAGKLQDGSGKLNLTKSGSGVLTLSGANTYTGATTVSGGLRAANTSAFGNGSAVTLQSGATLDLNGYSVNIGSLSSTDGHGVVTNYGYGSPGYGYGSGYPLSATLTEGGDNTNSTFTGVIRDGYFPNYGFTSAIALTKTGTGTLTLTGTDTYGNGTTINAGGKLKLGDGSSNNGSVNNGITDNGALEFANPNAQTFSGVISGTGTLTKSGAGTLTLSAANTYTGVTTLSGGKLNVGHAESAGTSGPLGKSAASNPGNIVFSGGTLQYSTSNHNDYSGRFSTAANQSISIDTNSQSVTFATALTSSGGTLTKLGANTLTLSGASTYSGATTVSTGTLKAGATNAFSSNSGVTVASGASLDLAGLSESIDSLGGSGTVTNSGSANIALTLGANNGSDSFAGVIQDGNSGGTTALTKSGTGTETLTGVNTYTGATSVSSGKLALGAGGSLANTAISVASGATFAPNPPGSGSVSAGTNDDGTAGATLTLATGSTFDMTDGSTGTFNLQQQASFSGTALSISGATLNFDLSASAADELAVSGAAALSGTDNINITTLGTSLTVGNSYILISAASGLSDSGLNDNFVFASTGTTTEPVTVAGQNYVLVLCNTDNTECVSVADANYWVRGATTPPTSIDAVDIDDSTSGTLNLIATGIHGNVTRADIYWDSNNNNIWEPSSDRLLGSADASSSWTITLTADGNGGWLLPDNSDVNFGTAVGMPVFFGVPIGPGGTGLAGTGGGIVEHRPPPAPGTGVVGVPLFVPELNEQNNGIISSSRIYTSAGTSDPPEGDSNTIGGTFQDNHIVAQAYSLRSITQGARSLGATTALVEHTYWPQGGFGVSGIISAAGIATADGTSDGTTNLNGAYAQSDVHVDGNQTWDLVDSATGAAPPVNSVVVQGYFVWIYGGGATAGGTWGGDPQDGAVIGGSIDFTLTTNDGHTLNVAADSTTGIGNGQAPPVPVVNVTALNYTDVNNPNGISLPVPPNLSAYGYSLGIAFQWVMPAVAGPITANVNYTATVNEWAGSDNSQSGGTKIASCMGTYYLALTVVRYVPDPPDPRSSIVMKISDADLAPESCPTSAAKVSLAVAAPASATVLPDVGPGSPMAGSTIATMNASRSGTVYRTYGGEENPAYPTVRVDLASDWNDLLSAERAERISGELINVALPRRLG